MNRNFQARAENSIKKNEREFYFYTKFFLFVYLPSGR